MKKIRGWLFGVVISIFCLSGICFYFLQKNTNSFSISHINDKQVTLKDKIDTTFKNYLNGIYPPLKRNRSYGGWTIKLPNGFGGTVRGILQYYAEPLISLGADAIPYILPWIGSKEPSIKYIAIYSLEKIMDIDLNLSVFDVENVKEKEMSAVCQCIDWMKKNRPDLLRCLEVE